MFPQNFIPAQRQRFRLIETGTGLKLAGPNDLARQFVDIDTGIHLVGRAIIGEFLVLVVGLDRDRRGIASEQPRGHADARDVH